MATEFKLPDLGEGVEAGDVVGVLVAEGDTVEIDQGVVELETDKALVEVPSSVAGTVTKIHVSAGDRVPIGSLLISVEEGEKSVPTAPAPKRNPSRQSPRTNAFQATCPHIQRRSHSRSTIHATARARTRRRYHPGRWLWTGWTHLTRRYQNRCTQSANRWFRPHSTCRIARLLEMGQHRTPTPQQSSADYCKKYEPGLATGGSCHSI